MRQFVKKHPQFGKGLLDAQSNSSLLGSRIGHFLKGMFEYYHLEVAEPSGTLAGEFLRALTVRSDVF